MLQQSQEKLKTMLIQNFGGGGGGANKVYYGRYAVGEFREQKAREIVCKKVTVALFLLSIGR